MSSNEIPVTAGSIPFEATTTPNIERANRLISVRAHPGFLDVLRLSQEIVQEAADNCADYPGWDAQQITVLKVRMQVAKEHHQRLLVKIQQVIENGIAEGQEFAANLPAKSAEESLDQGDYVRQRMLERFESQDEMRAAGSY